MEIILLIKQAVRFLTFYLILPLLAVSTILNFDKPGLFFKLGATLLGLAVFHGFMWMMERLFRHLAS